MNIIELAREERAALQNREQAELGYRTCWWRTTMATRDADGLELREAAAALGVSGGWMAQRKALARKVVGGVPVEHLVPRLAMEWARAHDALDAAGVAELARHEEQGTSLRALARELGTQPESAEQRAAARPSAAQIRAAVLEDPDVALAIAADGPAMLAVSAARSAVIANRTPVALPAPRPDDEQEDARNLLRADLYAAHRSLSGAHRRLSDVALPSELRAAVIDLAGIVATLATSLVDRLEGDREFDAALADLLAVQS